MTTQQKLAKLKEAIISAVPDIMELKFKCEVIVNNWHKGVIMGEAYGKYLYYNYNNQEVYLAEKDDIKIIGRPITLEDIFKTYRKNKTSNSCPLSISEKGDLVWEKEICYWEFGKPLDQQPEEAIDFLYNILCQ